MKILAVNISKALDRKDINNIVKIQIATERAWKLNAGKLILDIPEFVVGVASGIVYGYFNLKNATIDREPKRVRFTLNVCNEKDTRRIKIFLNGKNLKYFVTKQKWEEL